MKKVFQTKFSNNEKTTRGNCFAAVIASIMDKDSADDVIQVQDHYGNGENWVQIVFDWLRERGYEWHGIDKNNIKKDEFYLVSGKSPRFPDIHHICVYQNGKLYHDPHPDGTGLLTEEYFEVIEPINP